MIKDEVVDIAEDEQNEGEEQEQLVSVNLGEFRKSCAFWSWVHRALSVSPSKDEHEGWDEESQASYYAEAEGVAPNSQDMPQNIPPEINPSVSWPLSVFACWSSSDCKLAR